MSVSLIYLSIYCIFGFIALLRPKMILIKGETLLKFNFLTLILVLLLLSWKGMDIGWMNYTVSFGIIILSYIGRKLWFILKWDNKLANLAIKKSLESILISFTQENKKFKITISGEVVDILAYGPLMKCGILKFTQHKKVGKMKVFLKLLNKKFNSLVPRLIINLK